MHLFGTCLHGLELSSSQNTIFNSKVKYSNHSALNISGNLNFTTKFNQTFFTQKLINEQAADGSWHQLVDLNRKEGSLDATIFNCKFYFYFRLVFKRCWSWLKLLNNEKSKKIHSWSWRNLRSSSDDKIQIGCFRSIWMALTSLHSIVHF